MADQLFTTQDIDSAGRQLILDNQISFVSYYDASAETWDKAGLNSQSWYTEKYLPSDSFDTETYLDDRWILIDTPQISESTHNQASGKLNLGVERDEGVVGLSSLGKWGLVGDFDIRLYIDWSSYYNEYRGITHSFLRVGKDDENAVRVTFCFDGVGYRFSSEKAIGRNLIYFDWVENGEGHEVDFDDAQDFICFKIIRTAGVIRTYASTTTQDVQIGEAVSEAVFADELFVDIGIESKEFNTYRHSFTKFFIKGQASPTREYFSSTRGTDQGFPDRSMLVVDGTSLSIIDYDTKSLWMRFILGPENAISSPEIRAKGCEGTIYVTSPTGLIAIDLAADKIYKYSAGNVLVSIDPIALRNTSQIFKTHLSNMGTLVSDKINDVSCRKLFGQTYLALATDAGVSVRRPMIAGVYNSVDGELPAILVEFSDSGSLYWAGFNPTTNKGNLSYRTNITSLVTGAGTNSFSRTGFYSTTSALSFFGEHIQSFDVRPAGNREVIAVGSSEGLTFIGFTPDMLAMRSISYGVSSVASNPIADPSFENYLGLDWKTYYKGFHKKFSAALHTSFISAGSYSLRLKFKERTEDSYFEAGTYGGVYQDVDLTGVHTLYYDLKMVGTESTNAWNFQILVDDILLKEYKDTEAPFTKLTDSVTLENISGVHRLWFRIYVPSNHSYMNIDDREVYIDNIRTSIGNPSYRILPPGNASIKEVLLQYEPSGRKIYFASPDGYGTIDIDHNNLESFTELEFRVPETEILSGDFTREEQ